MMLRDGLQLDAEENDNEETHTLETSDEDSDLDALARGYAKRKQVMEQIWRDRS
jgi:hypothetical protein